MKLQDVILRGTRALQPLASVVAVGTLYYVSNEGLLERSSGVVWESVSGRGVVPPVDAEFAWINQGTATIAAAAGSLLLATTADALRLRKQAAPATPYTLTVALEPVLGKITASGSVYGVGFRQASDGKLHLLMLHMSDQGEMLSIKFTNETTFSAVYSGGQSGQAVAVSAFGPLQTVNNVRLPFPVRWFRLADNGTNRIVSYSPNGLDWIAFHTIGRTDFLTATELCYFVNAADVSIPAAVRLHSWLLA